MVESSTCSAIIPCFNEEATIAALVRAVREHLPLVIVVDDGSTDTTAALARVAGAKVVSHAKNFGKGPGFGIGLLLLSLIFLPILAFGSAEYCGEAQQ